MVRKIYSNAIYLRKKQNERKVYQRTNNVLPTDVPGAGEEIPDVIDESEIPSDSELKDEEIPESVSEDESLGNE